MSMMPRANWIFDIAFNVLLRGNVAFATGVTWASSQGEAGPTRGGNEYNLDGRPFHIPYHIVPHRARQEEGEPVLYLDIFSVASVPRPALPRGNDFEMTEHIVN